MPIEASIVVRAGTETRPVVVRDRYSRVVHTGVTNTEFLVDEGLYVVDARLPGNQHLLGTVEAVAGGMYLVDLEIPDRPGELSRITPTPMDQVTLAAAQEGATPPGWHITYLRVRPPFGFEPDERPRHILTDDAGGFRQLRLSFPRGGGFFVRVRVPSSTAVTVALPGRSRCLLVGGPGGTGPAVAAYPSGGVAQLAAQYLAFEDTDQGALLFPQRQTAAWARGGVVENAIGSTIAGYLFLRQGKVDRLAGWLDLLARRATWLPDGAVIAADVGARAGDHATAARLLIEAGRRGVPIFTDGFSIMASLLRRYTRTGGVRIDLPISDRAALDRLGRLYGQWAPFVDFAVPTTTFSGSPDK